MSRKSVIISIAALLTLVASFGIAQASHETLDLCCAWNSELADGELTYSISGGTDEARMTVEDAVQAWDAKIADLTLTRTSVKET